MQNAAWLALLHRIPAARIDSLVVTLHTGTEIMIQNLTRLEADFMIIRGRVAGSNEDGRVTIIPYDQICSLGFSKRMTEAEIHEIFSKGQPALPPPAPVVEAAETPREEPSAASELQPESTPVIPEQPAATTGTEIPGEDPAPVKPLMPSKSLLLARLRARLAEKSKGPS
jgi:hypothetical protein